MTRVGILGASNSVLNYSYVKLLSGYENLEVNNYAIGGTTGIYSLIADERFSVFDKHDIIIFEYFVTDIAFHLDGFANVENIKNSLIEIIHRCHGKRLLFVLIYCHSQIPQYKESPVYNLYKEVMEEYNISNVDGFDLLESVCEGWYDETLPFDHSHYL